MDTEHREPATPSGPKSIRLTRGANGNSRGWSPARMQRMHDVVRRDVDAGRIPGLVTLVSRRGEEHVDAIGRLAFGASAPMRRDTIFRLGTLSQSITAVGGMILVEECKLRLDDPIDEWLPELANRRVLRAVGGPLDDTVPAARAITARDLFTSRSGYGEVVLVAGNSPLQRALVETRLPLGGSPFVDTPDELLKRLGALPLAHQPGERWLPSTSADILGVLVARVAATSLGTFLRERVFEPLGMKDTGFRVPDASLDRFATCYRADPSSGQTVVRDDARGGVFARTPVFEGGGGGLVSTVDDLHAFGRMMSSKGAHGRERILARPTIDLMTADQLTPEQKGASPLGPWPSGTRGWGFGVSVVTRREEIARSVGTFGCDGALGTSWYVDPSEDLIGILLSQRVPDTPKPPPLVGDFWTSVYQAIDD